MDVHLYVCVCATRRGVRREVGENARAPILVQKVMMITACLKFIVKKEN